jgi:MFS family permease
MLAYALANLVVSPFAGALVDRYDRRWVMILSDTGAGLATLSIAALYMTGNLAVWNIILATAFTSAFSAFQWPAYSAVTTLLVPKEQLGRARCALCDYRFRWCDPDRFCDLPVCRADLADRAGAQS